MRAVRAMAFVLAIATAQDGRGADVGGYVSSVAIHLASHSKSECCSTPLEKVGSKDFATGNIFVDSHPLFVSADPVRWRPCVADESGTICLSFSDNDLLRWNLLHSGERHKLALVVNGKVISLLLVRGVATDPIRIGQVDGAPDSADLQAYLYANPN